MSKFETLYECNDEDYQENMQVDYMKMISKIKNGTLINTYTSQIVCISNFIEFIDKSDNKIIIDIKNNHIHTRNNYKIEYTKKEILF